MSPSSLSQSLLRLPVAERVALADQLYASVPEDWQQEADQSWLDEAKRRVVEMDTDPAVELSQEHFLSGIRGQRPRA